MPSKARLATEKVPDRVRDMQERAGGKRSAMPAESIVRLRPLKHVNLTERVYEVLKDRILSQEIEVGTRPRDEDLATQLGVSRTPVREALMRLDREGLVEIFPRSGTRVRTFTEEDIEHIFDVRMALESLAARKAADRVQERQLIQLREMYQRGERALKEGDTAPALELDRYMHRLIIEASGNRKLQELMNTVNDFVTLFRNLGARTPEHRGFTYGQGEIVRALERRDGERAARALSKHIEVAKQQLFRDFRRRRLLDGATRSR